MERNILSHIEEITQRLERIEKKIDECCGPICIDFTKRGAVKLSNPHTETIGNHTFVFSTHNTVGLGLEIRPNGLNIPYELKIDISPPCKKVTIEVSSFAHLKWEAFDSSGNILQSIPPPPVPRNTPSYTFAIIGNVKRLEFDSGNEEDIKKICCNRH